ncbi:MAG: hypothetical protein ACXIUM_10300 [Wenzhouxiangella sp.]
MYRWFLILAVFLAAAAGLLIGVLNPDPVTLELAIFAPTLPKGALVVAVFGAGVLAGLLLFWLLFALPARWQRRVRPESHPGVKLRTLND